MVNMSNTKAQLFAAYTALDAEAVAQRHTICALRDDLAMAQSAPLLPHGKPTHAAYYDYVRSERTAQRGQRVCSYKTYTQWSAA